VQNDGASSELPRRNAVNTVADGIYHLGFEIRHNCLLNEDGNKNASLEDVAYWIGDLLQEDLAAGTLANHNLVPDFETIGRAEVFFFASVGEAGDPTPPIPGEPDDPPPPILGDFNADGLVDAQDIDLLFANFSENGDAYDLTGDGVVDKNDADLLVMDVLGTVYGDTDLDGDVDFDDVRAMLSGYGETGGWANGDYNGDGQVNLGDLSILASNYGFRR
jgi:hypothetical protein